MGSNSVLVNDRSMADILAWCDVDVTKEEIVKEKTSNEPSRTEILARYNNDMTGDGPENKRDRAYKGFMESKSALAAEFTLNVRDRLRQRFMPKIIAENVVANMRLALTESWERSISKMADEITTAVVQKLGNGGFVKK